MNAFVLKKYTALISARQHKNESIFHTNCNYIVFSFYFLYFFAFYEQTNYHSFIFTQKNVDKHSLVNYTFVIIRQGRCGFFICNALFLQQEEAIRIHKKSCTIDSE